MNITFKNIGILGNIVSENKLYKQYHYPEMLSRYDSNFIAFKKMPSPSELKDVERYLRSFHSQYGQLHIKFVFPQDKKLEGQLTEYLNQQDYEIGFYELYSINPGEFPDVLRNTDVQVKPVSEETLQDYLNLQYDQDVQFGEVFAKEKQKLLIVDFQEQNVAQIIAYYQETPVGSVDVILSEGIAEIDNLFVIDSFQRKGIGSMIQRYVMDSYQDRKVILVADGEDTPKEMYKKQGYHFLGYQYEALKIYK